MEKKINIAELLKDCPKGMELDCTMYDDLVFVEVDLEAKDYPITTRLTNGTQRWFTSDGRYELTNDAKCVIFPKGKTTWEGFVPPCKFKDGDIITDSLGTCIFKEEGRIKGTVNYYCGISNDYFCVKDDKCNPNGHYGDMVDYRLATEEEKEKLFKAIKDNGYKWNSETKTLEKLSESKEDVDDEILMSGIYFDRKYYADEVELHLDNYEIEIRDGRTYAVFKKLGHKFKVGDRIKQIGSDRHYIIKNIEFDRYILNNNQFIRFIDEHIYELAPNKLVEPKFKVGDRIIERNSINISWIVTSVSSEYYGLKLPNGSEGIGVLPVSEQDKWELVPNKFDINTLKPFESRVLVRDNDYDEWRGAFWSHLRQKADIKYDTIRGAYRQCIPCNDDTKHLLGTTNDCDEYYKTWEE